MIRVSSFLVFWNSKCFTVQILFYMSSLTFTIPYIYQRSLLINRTSSEIKFQLWKYIVENDNILRNCCTIYDKIDDTSVYSQISFFPFFAAIYSWISWYILHKLESKGQEYSITFIWRFFGKILLPWHNKIVNIFRTILKDLTFPTKCNLTNDPRSHQTN